MVKSIDEVRSELKNVGHDIGHTSNRSEGKEFNVFISKMGATLRELYLSFLDRTSSQVTVIASTEGGMDIEEVAAATPEKILTLSIDPATGMMPHHIRRICTQLELTGATAKKATSFLRGIFRAFCEKDAAMIEINPLVVTGDDDLMALDAKIGFDDNALYRHPDILELRDLSEEDPAEVRASEFGELSN